MALAVHVLGRLKIDGPGATQKFGVIAECTGDASYPAGGYPATAAMFGLKTIEAVFSGGSFTTSEAALRLASQWDYTNSKILLSTAGTADAGLNEAGAGDVTATSKWVMLVIGAKLSG